MRNLATAGCLSAILVLSACAQPSSPPQGAGMMGQGGHRITVECRAGAPAVVGRTGKIARVLAGVNAP